MRVVVLTSDLLTPAKREIAAGLGPRLAGIGAVPIVPRQVGFWRHVRSLATAVGHAGIAAAVVTSASARAARALGSLGLSGRFAGVRGLARELGVGYCRGRDPGDAHLLRWLVGQRPDLVVSLHSHRVPSSALGIPRLGWLNLHHGRLPDFRGAFSVFWAMRAGHQTLYVTTHLMGHRLDDGPVVVEEPVRVEPGVSVAEMEATMWAVSPRIVLEAVERLDAAGTEIIARPRSAGRYYGYPTRRDIEAARLAGLRLR